ncbi:hypothetical protein ACQ4PT_031128 [Festuca glaucescens]
MSSIVKRRHDPLSLLYLVILGAQLSSSVAVRYSNHTSVGGVQPVHCLPDQASALLRLRRSFTVTNESVCTLGSWRAGTNCCRWEGVRCHDANGRVTSLDLGGCLLESPALDPAVFSLTSIRHLNLAWNYFNGSQLPASGFERLAELRHLNLSSSSFGGHIPVGIGGLTNLVSLDLSTSFYVVEDLDGYSEIDTYSDPSLWLVEPNITSLVANLANLRELNLDWADLSRNGPEWCTAFSNSTTPHLQVLSLRHSILDGPICGSLSSIPSLTVIDLQYNHLYGSIPDFLADLPSLSVLRLTLNNLEGQFPVRIFSNQNLTALDIRHNVGISGSLPDFSSDSKLVKLLVSHTNLSGPIPSSLGNLKSLNMLGVAATDFTQELPSSIGELTSLNFLEATGAGIVGSMPSWVTRLSSLVRLEFSSCGLSGHIPSSISNLMNLNWLALYSCNFSDPIPPQLYKFTQMKRLYLHSNKFTGTVKLSSFYEIPHLISLSLSNNRLSVIDGEFNSSGEMLSLRLASCNITSIPDTLRNIRVRYLDLSDNQIHGAIPTWAWKIWDNMIALNLSHNQFNTIGFNSRFLGGIEALDISSNLIEGPIPIPIPSPGIEMFDCSNNLFSSIPNNFGSQLISISYLSAARNNLSGEIPPSICDARGLQFLDLSYNNLSGLIPPCLMEDTYSLGVLNLNANQLQGELPHNFRQDCAPEEINLSNNWIEGQLPRSLAYCRGLQVLDIGNNHINDTFPCWMSMLPQLQVLVLKSNQFFGHVGPSAVRNNENHCEFTNLRILSLASNDFYGTLPNNWFKSFSSMVAESNIRTLLMQNVFGQFDRTYQFTTAITYRGSAVTFSKILKTLVIIDVSDNAFHGTIPESIGELVLLGGLNMSHNALTGTITSQLGALHQLESLDISSNGLSGEIPQELAWLDFLSVLNLSYNQIGWQNTRNTSFPDILKSHIHGKHWPVWTSIVQAMWQLSSKHDITSFG